MSIGSRSLVRWGGVAGIMLAVIMAAGLAPAERGGAVAGLRPGMPVTLKEASGRFEIGVVVGVPGPLGHEVVAVGDDHVVVRDVAGITEIWIPVTSLSCVRTTRVAR